MPDMHDPPDDQALVGTIHASSGAKVVVVSKLVGNIYTGPSTTVSPDQLQARRQTQEQRNRASAIQRVRADWIDGFLRQSLENIARVELRLTPQQSSVALGLNTIVQTPGKMPAAITSLTDISTIFDSFEQSLLILGAPGSGKTTLLLQLAEELLHRAETDPSQRIPFVFNLSSWAVKRKSLTLWMADEMNRRSDIPKRLATEWIDNDQIIPLLDGLDEVDPAYRLVCLQAINHYRSEHGFVPIAVCSRIADYESLGEKLRLRNAVVVQDLEDHDVHAALSRNSELAILYAAVQADPSFAEILRTPLMLWIAALAYRNVSATIDTSESPEVIRHRLFGAYVEAMFQRRGPSVRYSQQDTLCWLVWLARALDRNKLTIFTLESLDSSFMPTRGQRILSRFTVWIGVVLLYAVVCLLVSTIAYGISGLTIQLLYHMKVHGMWAMDWSDQFDYMYVIGLGVALSMGPVFGIYAAATPLRPTEKIDLSVRNIFRRIKPSLQLMAIFYPLLKITSYLLDAFSRNSLDFSWQAILKDIHDDFKLEKIFSPASPVFVVIICGLFRLFITETSEVRSRCNEGTRRSAKIASITTTVIILFGIWIALRDGLINWVYLASLIAGLAGGFFIMKHYALRFMLWASRLGPFNYAAFLNQANERILLRRIGGGYVFTHRTLLEYFTRQDAFLKKQKAPKPAP
jgi:DNA polymerase III delta prime subunit